MACSEPCQRPKINHFTEIVTQLTFTCSKSTIETPEKGVKNVQS